MCPQRRSSSTIHTLYRRSEFDAYDIYCVREPEPLIEQHHWLFATKRYDEKTPEELRSEVFNGLRTLKEVTAPAVQRFAIYGFFFDWIEKYIDPIVFRSLFEMLASHDFQRIEGDLLGRFFEIYAQKINKTKRRALGQYYTPPSIVEFIWFLALKVINTRNVIPNLQVLDPGMGSGTFLAKGARLLCSLGIKDFWNRLTGFDISAQVLGIAYVNLYISILSQLDRGRAENVGDLQIYATDALDPKNGQYLKQILPLIPDPHYKNFIEQRIRVSAEVKKNGSFTLVIGNPPYRNNSKLTLAQVAALFPRLLESSVQNAHSQQRNPRDDYAWFFAAADYYVKDRGLIAFIVSDSFAQNLSYRFFRIDLLKHYSILKLIRLGSSVFRDVGPRISFAIIVLEKRLVPLASPDDAEAHACIDLRPLIAQNSENELGTDSDARFGLMSAVVSGTAELPPPTKLKPSPEVNYSLYPTEPIVDLVRADSLTICEKGGAGLYREKWPGLITAFDELLKARTRLELEDRMSGFFELCQRRGLNPARRAIAVEAWGREKQISDDNLQRLRDLAFQLNQKGFGFEPAKIKRALDGAMPNDRKWYPPRDNTVFVYYDTRLEFPRNKNEGKVVGWGSMQQWREPQSHAIAPKLIYTTASKPKYGLKAFVVDDEWYVKLHGGTSQQYNYTGLHNPSVVSRIDGLPNNLTDEGLELLTRFTDFGCPAEAVNHYVAAIYNSELAHEFLNQVGSSTRMRIKIVNSENIELAKKLYAAARTLRDIFWLNHLLAGEESIDEESVVHFPTTLLVQLDLCRIQRTARKFKERTVYKVGQAFPYRVVELADRFQQDIDELTADLYS